MRGAKWNRSKVALALSVLAAIGLVGGVLADVLHRSAPGPATALTVICGIALLSLLLLGFVLPTLAMLAELSINVAAFVVRLARRTRPGA